MQPGHHGEDEDELAERLWRDGLFSSSPPPPESDSAVTGDKGGAASDVAAVVTEFGKDVRFTFGSVAFSVPPLDVDGALSSRIWRCSLLLAVYISTHFESLCCDKTVLELGCGRALGGMAAGACGAAHVTLTDCDNRVLGMLRSVLPSDRFSVRHLLWEEEAEDRDAQVHHWSDAYRSSTIERLDDK